LEGFEVETSRMSSPDSTDADDVSNADTAFGELLAEVAKGPQASLLTEGATVGEYRVVKQLGRGAFGAVYHAVHAVIGKQVAIKVLNAQFSEDAAMAARFVDEARAVNRIAHPNIVDIFGFGVLPDGRKYCVMELLSGETLGACLERRHHLPVGEAAVILTQVASALDAAHQSAVVHRDLKPDNIFLCRAPQTAGEDAPVKVKLLDFGIAQMADGLHSRTGSNMVLGTPGYMSPEQCRGARIDFRSDIYALGVVAFELLTGTLPFQGTNAFQVTAQHLTAPPPAPSERLPELAGPIDSAVLRMLSKSPADRPASASEAIRSLSSLATVPPPSAAAPAASTGLPLAAPVTGSARGLLIAAGVAAVLALVAAGARLLRSPSLERPVSAEKPSALVAGAAPHEQVAAPVASEVAPPHPPSSVTLRVTGQPASARVFLGTRELAKLGESFSLERSETPIALRVKAPGFAARELPVTPSRDQDLEIKLVRAPRRPNAELEY
jgi:serine/threonine-protein kinase